MTVLGTACGNCHRVFASSYEVEDVQQALYDLVDVDISLPEDEFDVEARDEVREYAKHVATAGWEFINLSSTTVSWWNPDGRGVYRLERNKSGWHGVLDGNDALPEYTDDLGAALETAHDVMAENPVERDT